MKGEPSLFPLATARPSFMGRVGRAILPLVVAAVLLYVLSPFDVGGLDWTSGDDMLKPGTVLATWDTEESGLNHNVWFPSDIDVARVVIWDYAEEDGDWVQLLFNGQPLGQAFMIQHEPQSFMVPVDGTLEVLGIRDGGGGITYGITFSERRLSILNGTSVQLSNRYLLYRDGEP